MTRQRILLQIAEMEARLDEIEAIKAAGTTTPEDLVKLQSEMNQLLVKSQNLRRSIQASAPEIRKN